MKGEAGEKILLEAIERILGNCERLVVGYPQCIPIELRNTMLLYNALPDEPAQVERDLTPKEALSKVTELWGSEANIYIERMWHLGPLIFRISDGIQYRGEGTSLREAFEKAGVKVEGGK